QTKASLIQARASRVDGADEGALQKPPLVHGRHPDLVADDEGLVALDGLERPERRPRRRHGRALRHSDSHPRPAERPMQGREVLPEGRRIGPSEGKGWVPPAESHVPCTRRTQRAALAFSKLPESWRY